MNTRIVTAHLPAELAEKRHRLTLEALEESMQAARSSTLRWKRGRKTCPPL